MVKFSERMGLVKPRFEPQIDDIDEKTRNVLWNVVSLVVLNRNKVSASGFNEPYLTEYGYNFAERLYLQHLKKPHDDAPSSPSGLILEIKEYILTREWWEVYDLVEWIAKFLDCSDQFEGCINLALEREISAYRFTNGELVQIVAKDEIEEVNNAIANEGKFALASKHLASAVSSLSDRQSPDFPNSIKESISAVEAAAKIITGNEKASLGESLEVLEKNGHLHPALAKGYNKIYGWTSDEGGIRHALSDKGDVEITLADARYMLVSCSAFVNYLISNAENATPPPVIAAQAAIDA